MSVFRANGRNNSQHCCANNVESCYVHVGSGVQTATRRSRIRIPLKPWFFFFFRLLLSNCLNWKIYCDDHSSLSLPTMLGAALHRGKDTTHKSLLTIRNERARPQKCWKSCANGSNFIALRFGDHGRKEMLGVVGWKVWPVSNFAQQHATTSNNMQQGVQTDPKCNIQQC